MSIFSLDFYTFLRRQDSVNCIVQIMNGNGDGLAWMMIMNSGDNIINIIIPNIISKISKFCWNIHSYLFDMHHYSF